MLAFAGSVKAKTVLVVNKNFSGDITEEQLKELLKARSNSLSDGQQLSLLLPAQEEKREEIAQNLLNISNKKLQRRYNKIIFSGEGTTPKDIHPRMVSVYNEDASLLVTIKG